MDERRSIKTHIWADTWFESLESRSKIVWLHLLTNQYTNLLGIYEFSFKRGAFETGLSLEEYNLCIDGFIKDKKILFSGNYICLLNWVKNQTMNSNMKIHAKGLFDKLPDNVKKELCKNGIDCFNDLEDTKLKYKGLGNDSESIEEEKETITQPLPNHYPIIPNPSSEIEIEIEIEREIENRNKKKTSKKNVFVPPELLEVESYFLENGFTKELAVRFFKGYNESNWSDQRGNKIHNWKLKAQNVWFVNNDKFRITEGVQKLGKKSVLQSAQETVNGALKLIQEQYGTDANI